MGHEKCDKPNFIFFTSNEWLTGKTTNTEPKLVSL